MCGIAVGPTREVVEEMAARLAHRGPDEYAVRRVYEGLWFAHRRLRITGGDFGRQPFVTPNCTVMLNGEIYNYERLFPEARSEVAMLAALLPSNPALARMLDGKFAVVAFEPGRQRLTIIRDWLGIIPLYWDRESKLIASERQAFPDGSSPIEFPVGSTCIMTADWSMAAWATDPIPDWMPMHSMTAKALDTALTLLEEAVAKRVRHSDRPVTLALSGGIDSALIAGLLPHRPKVEAVTVVHDPDGAEARCAAMTAEAFAIPHRVVVVGALDAADRAACEASMKWHANPVERRGFLRSYLVAKHAPGVVLLSGDGGDEIGCGYPSHDRTAAGVDLEWKAHSTLRSLPQIALERTNRAGMLHGKEYRLPLLDRSFVAWMMAHEKRHAKAHLKAMARHLGVPISVLAKPKYTDEEIALGERLWQAS